MPSVARHRGGGISRAGERFRVRLRVGGTTVSVGYFDTEEEAIAARDAALAAVDGGAQISGAQTLGEWGATWLTRRETGGRVAGVQEEWSCWRRHVADHAIASVPLKALTRPMLARWLDHLEHDARVVLSVRKGASGREERPTDRRLSRGTIRHALRLVRGALKAAVRAGLIERNPASELGPPKASADETTGDGASWTWLTADEVAEVLTASHRPPLAPSGRPSKVPERHRLVWTIAIYTGLRRSELRALQWRDVDETELVVRKAKSRKTRLVPLLPPARAAFARWRELSPGIGPAHVWRPMRVKPGEVAPPRMHRDWDLGWRAWGPPILGRAVRVHDLRHTCASHLVQGTWGRALSLYEVKEWLGHSSIKVTERYAHLAPEGLRGIAEQMAASWPGAERERTTSGPADRTRKR